MLRVEFHCHTQHSKDSLTRPEDLVINCQRKGIDRVIVTDHNTIRGAQEACQIDPGRVIFGEEIMTRSGEILAAFVQEEIPGGLPAKEALQLLRQQNAFISISHPFDVFRGGHWNTHDLEEILPQVDAIETFNARCLSNRFNQQAQEFARQHQIPATVGSDAHTLVELGRATLLLPDFNNADELRLVIRAGKPQVRLSGGWVHLASRYASWRKQYRP
jgi:hypothetical protein